MRSFLEMWYDPIARKKILFLGGAGLIFLIFLIIIIVVAIPGSEPEHFHGRIVLDEVPLIDGYNNIPNNIYILERNQIEKFNFVDLRYNTKWTSSSNVYGSHTDLSRLKTGKVGGQFWVANADCASNYKDAIGRTLDQIDVIKRLIDKYPNEMAFVTTTEEIWQAFGQKKIASLIGVDGGHSIDSNMAVLRMYYKLGVRYMTLTNDCSTPWAQSHNEPDALAKGLTGFGKEVIAEMNRLGMIVDISHSSKDVMKAVLETSEAPVIFSHSSAANIYDSTSNVDDEVLQLLKKNKGLIMINFGTLVKDANATIDDAIKHLNYIKKTLESSEFVGIGANYDGIKIAPTGLEDVSQYPTLFDKLAEQKDQLWNRQDLKNLAGENFLNLMNRVQSVRDLKKSMPLKETLIPAEDLKNMNLSCRTDFKPEPPATTEEPKTTAEEPKTTAEGPKTTAEGIETTEEEPNTTAEEPKTTAEELETTAEEPKTTVEETTSNTAETT